jgi:hypothetical protein
MFRPSHESTIPSALGLWFGLLAPPGLWFLHLGLSYLLEDWHCVGNLHHVNLWLHGVTLVAVAAVAASGWVSWSAWSAVQDVPEAERTLHVDRARFMALAGILFAIAFAVIIVVGDIPVVVLDSCSY